MTVLALTLKEAARAVGRSEDHLRRCIRSNGDDPKRPHLPAKTDGRGYLIRVTDLEAWLDQLPDADAEAS